MTDWIEHTTDTCPVDPETVVEVRYRNPWMAARYWAGRLSARSVEWRGRDITHYRIITPAPTPPLFLGGDPAKPAWLDDPDPGADPAKPPEPEMTKTHKDYTGPAFATATKPEPDLITLRLECMKMAVSHFSILDREQAADRLLRYVLNGSVDKA
jgi:hypothetical protein